MLAPWLAALFVLPIILTGLAALHILLGWTGVRSGGALAVGIGGVMAATLWITASVGAGAVASVAAAMVGCAGLLLIGRVLRGANGAERWASFAVSGMNIHLALLRSNASTMTPRLKPTHGSMISAPFKRCPWLF